MAKFAAILLFCFPVAVGAQGIWNPQGQINPSLTDPRSSPSATPSERDGLFDAQPAARSRNSIFDSSDMQIGIEAIVQAEVPAIADQGTVVQIPTMFTTAMGTPVYQRGPHAASVTVGQLAVPGKAHKELQKAADVFRKGRLDEARTDVTKALTIWPRYSDALVFSSLLYLYDRQHGPASAAAEEAIRIDDTNGMAYIVLAATYNFAEDYDNALRVLESALRFRPDAWQGYFERARAEMGKGQFTSALADINRAGELAPPKTSILHFVKGAALFNLNRTSEAVLELQIYLRTNARGAAAEQALRMIERATSTP